MKFSVLLFGLSKVLLVASLVNKPFKKHIKNSNVRLLIKTRDNSTGRLFLFNRGKVRSVSGAQHPFDVALVFKDPGTGFSVLADRRKDAVFSAATRGDVHLEGMSFWAMWFEEATKLII
jgi:hypothetical protein